MLRSEVGPRLFRRLVERIREGQACGEVDLAIDAREAAVFLQMTMQGIQLGARAGGATPSVCAHSRDLLSTALDRARQGKSSAADVHPFMDRSVKKGDASER